MKKLLVTALFLFSFACQSTVPIQRLAQDTEDELGNLPTSAEICVGFAAQACLRLKSCGLIKDGMKCLVKTVGQCCAKEGGCIFDAAPIAVAFITTCGDELQDWSCVQLAKHETPLACDF